MSKDLSMKVNVLPVTTYNFLHVNDSALQIENFDISEKNSSRAELPQGVSIKEGVSFEEAGEVFRSFNDRIQITSDVARDPNGDTSKRDESQAIRTGMGRDVDNLFMSTGSKTDIYTVEEGVRLKSPIILKNSFEDGERTLLSQVIHAKKNSEVTVIIACSSSKETSGFVGISTRLLAEEGAKITLVKAQTLGDDFTHFYDIGGAALKSGRIELVTLELGGSKVYSSAYINLSERESTYLSNLGYLCRQDHELDMNYVADQRGTKTEALMQFKGVLMDTAKKTFRGTLDFKSGSSGSVGDEQEDALLLSPDVINRTMPVILCQEEDVEGRHGATIGQLGEELLFYMLSRGIDEDEAKRIMIKARLDSVARLIPDAEIMHKVQYYIQNIV